MILATIRVFIMGIAIRTPIALAHHQFFPLNPIVPTAGASAKEVS